ncbi:putative Site-specific recombinase [endosymbiont DhMRE of Dentiscutata heterogama]|uniref:hypothetical protein n=1 Tax=endosymbiont DhMRE of Dentiscutata heterogama TaxID=1609546 RepID=UPI000629D4B6|nr:hypothetical protein [endosymbiont DhMRE of Dentiscutata heterogama]CFW92756.1 putative Site-specific recombinase [endosymbiont DhMRE of Dentiscutata heterogama]
MSEISSKKTQAEKILETIEAQLRSLIAEKKALKKKFLDKLKDLTKQEKENKDWFDDNWREAERIENKLMLLWDYWKREVEILQLERKITAGVLPTEREEIMKEIQKLNAYNITLQKAFRQKKIDADVVTEIRKRLGIWEEKED